MNFCDLFENAVRNHRNKNAVIKYNKGEYETYTYNELQKASEKLFQNVSNTLKPGEIVGIYSSHSVILPVLLNIIHKCNCAFMFLDVNAEQIVNEIIIADIKINKIFLIDKVINIDNYFCEDITSSISNLNCKLFLLSKISNDYSVNISNEIAYSIRTSGSTGIAKYVLVLHKCIEPNINDFEILFHVTSNDVIYFSTPLTFDPSVVELYLSTKCGAALMIAPPKRNIIFPKHNFSKYNITIWQTTPSLFLMFGLGEIENIVLNDDSALRVLALGGEPLYYDFFRLKSRCNRTEIFCLYGITEISCWASAEKINSTGYITENGLYLGNILNRTLIQVRDTNGETITDKLGDLCIGSATRKCLVGDECLNYMNDNSKFINYDTVTWRNTGDLGKEVNGHIYFNGRRDRLIKRFGNKVNLLEIETVALKFRLVNQCICIWYALKNSLVLLFTSNESIENALWIHLKSSLNTYSLPDYVLQVDQLPKNTNGKISMSKSIELHETLIKNENKSIVCGVNYFLSLLTKHIQCEVNIDNIKQKSFSDIGGTSIAAVQLANEFENYYNRTFPDLYSNLLDKECSLEIIMNTLKNVNFKLETNSNVMSNDKVYNNSVVTASNSIKRKLSMSETESHKKNIVNSKFGIEMVWSYNTGKCVDAKPILYTNESNQAYVLIGSHSGIAAILNADSGVPHFTTNLKSRIEAPFYCFTNNTFPFAVVGCYDGSFWCFSIDNKRVQWKTMLNSMIKSQACHILSKIYVGTYESKIYTICMNTGILLSEIAISSKGIAADLLCDGVHIFAATLDGTCAGIDCSNEMQNIMWRRTLESPIFAKPSFLRNRSFVLFCEVNHKIHCLDSKTGDCIWIFNDIQGLTFSSCSVSSVTNDDLIIFGCHDRHTYKLRSRATAATTPTLDWKVKHASEVYATPHIRDDLSTISISSNGCLQLIDEFGDVEVDYSLPGEVFSSPAIDKDLIFVGCRDNNIYCLKVV